MMKDKEARKMVMILVGILQEKKTISADDVKRIFDSEIMTISTFK